MNFPLVHSSRQRIKGFTVVELMAVMVVSGVLLAMLLSGMGQVRSRAADGKCIQQLKQLASAGLLFAADRGGVLPYRGDWAHPYIVERSLLPYIGIPMRAYGEAEQFVDSVLTCPAAQRGAEKTKQELHRTYSINQYATGGEAGSSAVQTTWKQHVEARESPTRLALAEAPAQQAFFTDGTALREDGYLRYSAFQAPNRLAPMGEDGSADWRTPFVHQGRIYVAYLDGHVGALSKEEAERDLVGPTNSAGSPRTKPFWGAKR